MALSVLNTGLSQEKELSEKLSLPLQESPQDYFLFFQDQQWLVGHGQQGSKFQIELDFNKEFERLQGQRLNPKKDLLSKALGYEAGRVQTVLDGTLGLAKDAVHMLHCGFTVIGCERNPVTHFLLQQAFEKCTTEECQKFSIIEGDVESLLSNMRDQVDVLYLDPMFENARQKSAPKKGLAFLRTISAVDVDVHRVIEKALDLKIKRVVVKRPLKGGQLFDKPSIVYEGKLVRYDVYRG